ncbi:MAG: alpha/beta-type small acid-soluble spore protein [Firmicutes bacterium]|nr:alpha/beta-type small acid-soluble spore protein [Bacillota bacterium]
MGRGANTTNKPIIWGAVGALDQFKYEVANELGIQTNKIKDGYWGELSSRECGAVGGHMVRRMIAAAEQSLIDQTTANVRSSFQTQLGNPTASAPNTNY